MFLKIKKVEVGQMVAVPVGLDYAQKSMEYENGIVLKISKSKKTGKMFAEVNYWHHWTKKIQAKLFYVDQLRKASYYHSVNEEQECKQALGVM